MLLTNGNSSQTFAISQSQSGFNVLESNVPVTTLIDTDFSGPLWKLAYGSLGGTVVSIDRYGTITAAALIGNASTASHLATARTIALAGDASGSTSFDGSANATISATLAASGVSAGTYTVSTIIVDAKGRVVSAASGTAGLTAEVDTLASVTARGATTSAALVLAGGVTISGTATAPTVTAGDNSSNIATTAFVTTAVAGGGSGGSTTPALVYYNDGTI